MFGQDHCLNCRTDPKLSPKLISFDPNFDILSTVMFPILPIFPRPYIAFRNISEKFPIFPVIFPTAETLVEMNVSNSDLIKTLIFPRRGLPTLSPLAAGPLPRRAPSTSQASQAHIPQCRECMGAVPFCALLCPVPFHRADAAPPGNYCYCCGGLGNSPALTFSPLWGMGALGAILPVIVSRSLGPHVRTLARPDP